MTVYAQMIKQSEIESRRAARATRPQDIARHARAAKALKRRANMMSIEDAEVETVHALRVDGILSASRLA